jgi:serine/threonine protein kinase
MIAQHFSVTKEKGITTMSDPIVMQKRDLEFPSNKVTVVEQRIEMVGPSEFYAAEEKPQGTRVAGASKQTFLVKATVTRTNDQAERAVAEARVLRRLPAHANILTMIDSGCSVMGPDIEEQDKDDAEPLHEHRTYCLLFEGSPSRSVRDIMEKQQRIFERCLRLSNGTSQRAPNSGWMDINTVMGVFRQMALAVSVLHGPTEKNVTKESSAQRRTIHMDLKPDHFYVYKNKTSSEDCKYIVKLIGAGCAVDISMRLDSIPDRKRAALLIDTHITQRYHAPEMVNLFLANELTDK